MPLRRALPVVRREDPEQTRAFWVDFLGFEAAVEEPGFLLLVSPDVETTQLIVGDPSVSAEAAEKLRDVDLSVDVGDVDAAYADASPAGSTSSTRSRRSRGGLVASSSGCPAAPW